MAFNRDYNYGEYVYFTQGDKKLTLEEIGVSFTVDVADITGYSSVWDSTHNIVIGGRITSEYKDQVYISVYDTRDNEPFKTTGYHGADIPRIHILS